MARGEIKNALEGRKAEKLLDDLRPSAAAYRRYRRRADGFLRDSGGPLSASSYPGKCVTALLMRKSIIFGREYLIACTNPRWFRRGFPSADAFATPGIELGSILSPPLVFVPETKIKSDGQDFRSILEHEFVHLNQIILGTFPESPKGTAGELLEWLFRATRAEYEANLLQLVRWPRLFRSARKKHGFSLEAWCVFRGYTQGLERIVSAVIGKEIEKKEFARFLGLLPDALPTGFRRMGFDGQMGEYCATRVTQHATTAIEILTESSVKYPAPAPDPLGWVADARGGASAPDRRATRSARGQEEDLPPF